MTGKELHQLILDKWGHSYDVQLRRTERHGILAQIMWRYLEQASFPLSEADYLERLSQVAAYLNEWGVGDQVREFIRTTKAKPRLGKAVSIPLVLGERSVEWFV